jgi:hypothetical protein
LDREGERETHTRAHTGGIDTRDTRDMRGTRIQTRARAHTHTQVLMMTIPGLALFYGGMVRVTNVLSTLMQVSSV